MLQWIPFTLLVLLACERRSETATDYQDDSGAELPAFYEGRVPLDNERYLNIELSIVPGRLDGEGRYSLSEVIEGDSERIRLPELSGSYSTSVGYGKSGDLFALQLFGSSREKGIKRIYDTGTTIREENFRISDLILLKKADLLVVLAANSEPVTMEPVHNLVRRTSRLFTVEGYLTHKGDTAEFLEMNTGAKFNVSKRGEYDEAIRQYHVLRSKKYESIYLKAVGFTIAHSGPNNVAPDVLVLKKLLQMTSAPN